MLSGFEDVLCCCMPRRPVGTAVLPVGWAHQLCLLLLLAVQRLCWLRHCPGPACRRCSIMRTTLASRTAQMEVRLGAVVQCQACTPSTALDIFRCEAIVRHMCAGWAIYANFPLLDSGRVFRLDWFIVFQRWNTMLAAGDPHAHHHRLPVPAPPGTHKLPVIKSMSFSGRQCSSLRHLTGLSIGELGACACGRCAPPLWASCQQRRCCRSSARTASTT